MHNNGHVVSYQSSPWVWSSSYTNVQTSSRTFTMPDFQTLSLIFDITLKQIETRYEVRNIKKSGALSSLLRPCQFSRLTLMRSSVQWREWRDWRAEIKCQDHSSHFITLVRVFLFYKEKHFFSPKLTTSVIEDISIYILIQGVGRS